MTSVSLWRRSARLERVECDVCVLGGGISGLSAAIELERRGMSVAILEAGPEVGSGASGRNAGFLMRGVAENYAAACRDYGREMAREALRLTERNLAALRAEGIESVEGYSARPSCLVALGEEEERELRESVTLLREDGFEAELLERGGGPDDPVWRSGRVRAGLVNPSDAVCNPVMLVRHLRSRVERSRVLTGQTAHTVRSDGDGALVETGDCEVRAGRVMACLNAYAPALFPSLRGVVTPRRGQMLAAVPSPGREALRYAYYANHGSEYFRAAPGGLIVFGGCRTYFADAEVGYGLETTEPVQTRIEAFLRELIDDGARVVARWAGTMGFSPDGLPLVGPLPGEEGLNGRVWFCGGFTGHGMSMAFETARGAVAAMLADRERLFPIERVFGRG